MSKAKFIKNEYYNYNNKKKINDFNLVNVFVFDLTSINFGSSKRIEIKKSTQTSSSPPI